MAEATLVKVGLCNGNNQRRIVEPVPFCSGRNERFISQLFYLP
jgi:hypothetical protein